jgi:cholesterol transport system auxiliary component
MTPTTHTTRAARPLPGRFPRLALAALLPAMLLAGCLGGVTSKREATQLYDLRPQPQADVAPMRPQQLSISEPRSGQILGGNRIAVRPLPDELRVYGGVAWRDPTPRMLQEALLRAFEDAQAFRAVGRQGSGLRGELLLLIDLRRFEAVYDTPGSSPRAVIEMQATLLEGARGNAVGSTRIEASRPVAGKEPPQVVAALGEAAAEAIDRLVRWTHAQAPAELEPGGRGGPAVSATEGAPGETSD